MSEMQREALAALTEIWSLSPDVRLGQLMAHLDLLSEAHVGKGLGYVEDDELIAVLYRHREELKARSAGVPDQTTRPPQAGASVSGSSMLSEAVPATEH